MTSDQIAFWSLIVSCISAFAAAIAAFFSYLATKSWEKQEKLKTRQEFKKNVFLYLEISRRLPHRAYPFERREKASDFETFRQAKSVCAYAWTLTEGEIRNHEISELWNRLNDTHHEYLAIRKSINDVQDIAHQIIETNFIY